MAVQDRYWIDERHGCIAIRDRCIAVMLDITRGTSLVPLWSDAPDVVWYEDAKPTGDLVVGAITGWDLTDARERAETRLRELNHV